MSPRLNFKGWTARLEQVLVSAYLDMLSLYRD
jgi:hypothetical protein